MSCTVIPLALLKSGLQHGIVPLLAALQIAWLLTNRVFVPVQAALLATIPHVAPRQHAPVVIGHGLGRQMVPSPRNVLGPTHAARALTMHAPVEAQHAPMGCTHDTPAHVALALLNTPGQSAPTLTRQFPSLRQHAPCAVEGQGVGVQGTPAIHCEMPEQLASSVAVHAPLLSTQHAPVCCNWHGLGVQEVAVPQALGTAQLACGVIVQVVPAGLQQVPCAGCGQVLGVQVPPLVHAPPDWHAP